METRARYHGALLGLATGDALGTTLEFKPPGSFAPLTTVIGGGPFQLHPGEWTDDTSMALCLAESLVTCQGFNPDDQIQRYVRWMNEGYYSVKSYCFDIGNTVSAALRRYERTQEPYTNSTDPRTAGNGSLMRLAPVPLAFARQPASAVEYAGLSSRTTHGSRTAVDACHYMAALLVGALRGEPKDELLAPYYTPVGNYWNEYPLHPEIDEIAAGIFKHKQPPEIMGTGYVVKSLEAALWAFYNSDDFRTGALLAVNLGDDADTTGAIYGQLAGAYYGLDGIPAEWHAHIAMRERILELADGLYALAGWPTGADAHD